jgi:hypothetical protein
MKYYIDDYDYEKHDLMVEEGDKSQHTGTWVDQPELFFYEDNVIKAGYSLSIVNEDKIIVNFYNDLILKAKDGHKLTVEEISIFILLLMNETNIQADIYLQENYSEYEFMDSPKSSAADIVDFVIDQMSALN